LGSLLAVLTTLVMPICWATTHDGHAGRAPLFADDSVLEVRIEAPLTTLMDVRPDEAYLDGVFSYRQANGVQKRLSLKLRTRGNYRRDPSHCDFAPIRLNFRTSELPGTLFEGQDKLKLVTHCRTVGGKEFEQLVAREYLAYRIFNEITSISYAVRMLRITYVDTETGEELRRLGFVIEDDEAVARRNGLQIVKIRRIEPEDVDRKRQNLVHLFEYMIANTEYSLVNPEPGKDCCHNMDVLSATGTPPYLHLPFDFDFAGLVNAPYAQPNPRYPIRVVGQRFYKGVCANNELLPATIDTFLARQDEVRRLLTKSSFVSSRSRRSVKRLVDTFYKTIADPGDVAEHLVGKCNERESSYGLTPDPDIPSFAN
jgi:hypothetical protein